MSTEAANRSTSGALTVKQQKTDELKPSSALTAEPKKVIIKNTDMKDDMQKEAVNIAIFAFEKNNVEKDVVEYIKKEFDKKHGPTWHFIVGHNFGNARMLTSQFSELRVEGLETLDYLDNLQNREQFTEQGDAITFESGVDKIYLSALTKIAILDHERKRTFEFLSCERMDFPMLGNRHFKKGKFELAKEKYEKGASGVQSCFAGPPHHWQNLILRTLPAGYLEIGESAAEGAIRETWEETGAEVEVISPFAQLDIPLIGQTYVIFLAKLKKPQFSPGPESSECCHFELDDIPFDSLAFSSIFVTLNLV
ncbi:hypothetical protein GOBAR_AA14124 [Gossypium barbadense]|uniref:Dynein light chain 1, cytoplasmic n=1 Tax=Gossypium barbadense TaxID=3634 RepID=A0A2P5XT47_GOSBA|nr:hypothetical protein GOBAR_AA14124 [Gossypium barbadense]